MVTRQHAAPGGFGNSDCARAIGRMRSGKSRFRLTYRLRVPQLTFISKLKEKPPDRANWAEVGGLNARDEGGPQVPQRENITITVIGLTSIDRYTYRQMGSEKTCQWL